MRPDLEAAYAAFLQGDVPADGPICLRWATLDNDKFVALQKKAKKGSKAQRRTAAESLLAMVESFPSPIVHDGIIAHVYGELGEHERSLELRLHALSVTPTWSPVLAAQVIGNIGYTLGELGDLEAAERWLGRALTFDPVNPFVLGTLGEILCKRGTFARARGLRDYLRSYGCPDAHCQDLDVALAAHGKAHGKAHGNVAPEPYAPKPSDLRPSSTRDFARLAAMTMSDAGTQMRERLRGLALGAAMRGELGAARLYAMEGAEAPWEGDEARGELEAAWNRGVLALLVDAGAPLLPDGQARAAAFDAAVAARDTRTLRSFLVDPVPPFRVIAAEAIGDADARTILEEQMKLDACEGVAAREPGSYPAGYALHRLHVKDAGKQPLLLMPRDPSSKTLRALKKGEGLVFFATFPGLFTPAEGQWFDGALQRAAAVIATKDPKQQVAITQNGQTVQVVVSASKAPAEVVRALLDVLAGEDTKLRELVFGRFELPDGKKKHLFHAVRDPDAPEVYVEEDDWWERSFDFAQPPPLSEPEDGPSFMMMQSPKGMIPEIRLMPIRFDDVRVIYGLDDVDDAPPHARHDEVRAAIGEAFHASFRGAAPTWFNRKEVENGLDSITKNGRKGYAFALSGMRPAFVVHYPSGFRFREAELLEGLRAAVLKLGLAKVVHWSRSAGTWIFNVWE